MVIYRGRPSHVDPRRAYSQRVVGKPKLTRQTLSDGSSRVTAVTRLRVRWLKQKGDGVQDEADDTILCVDSATSNAEKLAILNWCAPEGDPIVAHSMSLARSILLDDR